MRLKSTDERRSLDTQGEVSEVHVGRQQRHDHAKDADTEGYRDVGEAFALSVGMAN